MERPALPADRPLCGMLVKIGHSSAVVLVAMDAGLDFLFYDREHGILEDSRLHDLIILGNAAGIPSLVRLPQLSRKDVSQTLDCGAAGLLLPMTETEEQARQYIEWAMYPPLGRRSYAGGANTGYAPSGSHAHHMEVSNRDILPFVQIETARGAENAQSILSVPGVAGALIGPCDMGISLGYPDQMDSLPGLENIRHVQAVCRKLGKRFGLIGPLSLMEKLDHPVDIVISAIDLNLMRQGMEGAKAQFDAYVQKGGSDESTTADS